MPNPAAGFRREERFRKIMAVQGVELVRPIRPFRFRRTTYLPDFYCAATDVFYEVIGSRQRGVALAPVLDLMETVYPSVRLEVVTPDGAKYESKAGVRVAFLDSLPFGQALIDRMRRDRIGVGRLAERIGMHKSHFSTCLHRHRPLGAKYMERLQRYADGK